MEAIAEGLDNQSKILANFCDSSKDFDTVNHEILLDVITVWRYCASVSRIVSFKRIGTKTPFLVRYVLNRS